MKPQHTLLFSLFFFACTPNKEENFSKLSIKGGQEASELVKSFVLPIGRATKIANKPGFLKFHLVCSGSLFRAGENFFDILTAHHCGGDEKESLKIIAVSEVPDEIEEDKPYTLTQIALPSLAGDSFPQDVGILDENKLADIMILRFEGKLPDHYSPGQVKQKRPMFKGSGNLAGFGETHGYSWTEAGKLREVAVRVKFNNKGAIIGQDSERGSCRYDSGGPFFKIGFGNSKDIYGVISEAVYYMGECQGLNNITDITFFSDWINRTENDPSLWQKIESEQN